MTINNDTSFEPSFEVLPFTRTCRHIWEDGDHVLIGVSPGNSYFSADRIAGLAQWATERFAQVDFVYADLHVDRMFAAFGYTREHAGKRAAKEIKAVRRRILKGVEESGSPHAEIRVRALSEFQDNEVYKLLHRRVLHFLESDDEFRKGCERMALHFVGSKVPDGESITDEQLQVCFDYIAAELPFFLDTPSILDVPSSVSAYHVTMPLTEVLYARGGGLRATRNQAYAVVRPEAPDASAGSAAATATAAPAAPARERTADERRAA
ncbi:tRNA-dependent cyclodipeptide synthase [Streptomyces bambusae]|uniref:tRNA-dependent cyclodipeptide synthase n=1 Tax=Streptomyces bambusae TaxID=1550616 RepID=UPI001CFD9D86|nr:tRNA-dependent cyclodipeptide synthase [Streptomyces bambusae]MCB5166595.1 tRNA-dependent cyclodipeptide synthase [Streptomyces bambusae]